MAGSYVELCHPRTLTTIAVPPPNQQGIVKYGRVFFSLALDTELSAAPGASVHVRYEFGAAGNMEVHDAVLSTGRSNIHEIDPNKGDLQLITVHHQEPAGAPPVSVLIEFETRPDF